MTPFTQQKINEFQEKSKLLFTRGGLMVLLDYPPHEAVLDEKFVEKFITDALEEARKETLEEVKQILYSSLGAYSMNITKNKSTGEILEDILNVIEKKQTNHD